MWRTIFQSKSVQTMVSDVFFWIVEGAFTRWHRCTRVHIPICMNLYMSNKPLKVKIWGLLISVDYYTVLLSLPSGYCWIQCKSYWGKETDLLHISVHSGYIAEDITLYCTSKIMLLLDAFWNWNVPLCHRKWHFGKT